MDPAEEARIDRRRVSLACRQCHSRKIKCDGTHPVCLTCIRRKSPKCEYDNEPRRRGPDRHPRVRTHRESGPPPSSIRPRLSQKRASNNIVASPITPSTTQSPPDITSDASATTSATEMSNSLLTSLTGSFGGIRLYPSPSTSTLFPPGLVTETPTSNLFGASPSIRPSRRYPLTQNDSLLLPPISPPGRFDSGSVLNSFPVLHSEPSPSTDTRGGHTGGLSYERSHPNSGHRSVVHTRPHNPYLPDNGPHSSSEFPYIPPVIPMQVFAEAEEVRPLIVPSPYTFASSSFPNSTGANMVHSDPSVGPYLYHSIPKATDHMSASAYNTNFLPMASSHTQGSLVYGRFQDYGNDHQTHEDADEPDLRGFWTATPGIVAAHSYEMLNQPSVEFTRQLWWESLTRYYGGPRALAARRIMEDLSHLFRVSNYFVAFINVPLFFSAFRDPNQREHVQPSFVLAMLALSTILKSSDVGLGLAGRLKALELRDLAQSHFDMSLNSGWITPDLAQAALLFVLFEVSCHPTHSEGRVRSILFLLDSIIMGLGLLDLDKEEYSMTTFSPNNVPSLFARFSDHLGQAAIDQGATKPGCSCSHFQLSNTFPSSRKTSPFWAASPGWSEKWDVVETRREEQRRLVWSALTVICGHLSYQNSVTHPSPKFGTAKPWNFKVLLPAEKLYGVNDFAGKHTIWALHARCHMLYTSCLTVHHDESISEYDKGQFAVQAWLESERVEKMLSAHACDLERETLYFGRQLLFNTRNLVSSQYTRYIPHPNIRDPYFDRDKAILWLNHQKNIVQHFVPVLPRVAGLQDNVLADRPYITFWFYDQLRRCLDIWRQDPTLHIALDLCFPLLGPVEYLMTLFPSNYPKQSYEVLHQRLVDACILSGIPPPSPPSYR